MRRKLTCIKDYIMEGGTVAFAEGSTYDITRNEGTEISINCNENGYSHILLTAEEGFWEYFLREDTLSRKESTDENFDMGFEVVFKVENACDHSSFKDLGMTPIEYVRMMIESESLMGIVEDDFEIKDAWIEESSHDKP